MSSSAINTQVAQLKIGNVQNQADNSAVYSGGVWSLKNSTALTSVTITDAGNVGVGVTTPASYYLPNLVVNSAGNTGISIIGGASSIGALSFGKGTGVNVGDSSNRGKIWYDFSGDSLNFSTAGSLLSPNMRIDASGNLLVGQTSVGTVAGYGFSINPSIGAQAISHASGAASGSTYMAFAWSGNAVGSITQNGTTNVAFNTGPSDYRLKEQIENLSGGLEKIKTLRPVSFTWKTSGQADFGFIAHELQAAIPECITGEKDAVDSDGNPIYQSLFPAPAQMIATLVAAIQELSAKNEALEARLAALEAK